MASAEETPRAAAKARLAAALELAPLDPAWLAACKLCARYLRRVGDLSRRLECLLNKYLRVAPSGAPNDAQDLDVLRQAAPSSTFYYRGRFID